MGVCLELSVVLGVSVPSHVAHPHVKSSVGQDVGKTLIDKVRQPVSAGA